MGLFDLEQRLADTEYKYGQDRAAQEFGRFLSQQRFNRQRFDMDEGFRRGFPKVTAGLAQRGFGANVRGGQVGRTLNRTVGEFARNVDDLNTEQAGSEANFVAQSVGAESAYRQAILRLMEQIAAERAAANPFSSVGG